MSTYRLNTHVYVTHDTGGGVWFGTVVNAHPAGNRVVYTVRDGNGEDHSGIEAERMAQDLADGTRVQVAADAPHYASRVGYVHEPAIRDGMPGYWLHLAWPEETVWVPAGALTVLATEGGGTGD